jgi:DNA-binding transcriptional LysR family regulator
MDVRLLRTFVVVSERRNFTSAAEVLFLTQSAVSQQIRALETELGVALFTRSRTHTELTAAGRSLLPRAERMIAAADEIKAHFTGDRDLAGPLRIVAATIASSYLYVGLYERFARSHPDVALAIETGIGKPAAVERVVRGDADIAFVQLPGETATLHCDVLGETEIVVVANRETVVPSDLRKARFIVWDGSAEVARFLALHPEYRCVAATNDLTLIKRLLDANLGVAFIPRWAIAAELRSQALRVVTTQFPALRQRFGVAYRDGPRAATVDAFLGAAHDYRATIAALAQPEAPLAANAPAFAGAGN